MRLRQLLSLSRVADGCNEVVHGAHSADAQSDKTFLEVTPTLLAPGS